MVKIRRQLRRRTLTNLPRETTGSVEVVSAALGNLGDAPPEAGLALRLAGQGLDVLIILILSSLGHVSVEVGRALGPGGSHFGRVARVGSVCAWGRSH